jgi:phosphoribosylformimino-5-aminoimidazole carboxamide ribotide isomerase
MSAERQTPRLIPVLDVIGGVVVRAVGGERQRYWPVVSTLTASAEPVEVANALLAATGAKELYVADLDAIRWWMSDWALDTFLDHVETEVLLERGGLGAKSAPPRVRQIYSLESYSPENRSQFDSHRQHARSRGAIFSIDMRNGKLIDGWKDWGLPSAAGAFGLVQKAFDLGYRAFIVLDLARVGTGSGCGTEDLLRAIREEFPTVELIAGGGVKTWADVDRLGEAGADAVLLASALHDGTITFPRPAS